MRCPSIGATYTAQHLLRPPKGPRTNPRVYISRLQLLTGMVTEAGVQPECKDGIPLDPTVQLAMEWFNNANADVRENAVKLVAACYAHAGLRRIEKYLANIRQAQREIFDEEFERVDSGDGLGAGGDAPPHACPESCLLAASLARTGIWLEGPEAQGAMAKVKKQNLKTKAAKGKAKPTGKGAAGGGAGGGLVTNKKFGQHLLRNPGIVDKILNAADLKPSDTAFEIGPGTGNLTMKLLESCKRVIACEIDPRMASEVRKRAQGAGRMNLEVRESDCLKEKWPVFDVCVANLPYQISSPFTFKLLAHRPAFRCAVLMFQKEFAERLIAKVGEKQYGRLAVNTSLFVKVSCVCKVGRMNFTPPPEVDSMIVPRFPPIEVDFREWDGLMRICFGRKRKTLRSSFCMSYTLKTLEDNYLTWCALTGNRPEKKGSMKEKVIEVLSSLKLADQRAIKIDLDTYFKLLLEFNRRGIHFTNMNVGAKIGDSVGQLPDALFDEGDEDADDGMEVGETVYMQNASSDFLITFIPRWPWGVLLLLRCLAEEAEFVEEASESTRDPTTLLLDTWGFGPGTRQKNFEVAIKSHPYILVQFFAPWCGHCKQFAPEYAKAAQQLKQTNQPIRLAKVDATAEVKLAEDHGVRGYPTIRLFIDGRDQEYTGGRTEQSIVTWVLKKAGPPALELETVEAAEAFEKENRLAVFCFCDPAARAAFEQAARQIEDVMFAYSTAPEVAAKYEASMPSVKMFFPHDEQSALFTGDLNSAQDIEAFVKAHRHPMVTDFSGETAAELFSDGRPILFLFRDKDPKGEAAEKALRAAAGQLQRRLLVALSGSSEPMDQRLMDYVSVDVEELPTARLVTDPQGAMAKYRLSGEITEAALLGFVQDFEAGRLEKYLKSEPVPASQPGPVYTLVQSTFDSIVKDPTKDVLVEFYAPWCGHCKKLEPVYNAVAQKLQGVSSITIAKIDATANDVDGVDIEGFPTIKFWRADSKEEPLDYDGDRDV
ncbi:unnamed protein product, partial [Effrenium voratum]